MGWSGAFNGCALVCVSAETTGVLQANAAGLVFSTNGLDGQTFIADPATAPAWANLTAGTDISIVDAAGSITIATSGATAFHTDDGTATATLGDLNLYGGVNAQTEASGNTITINALTSTLFSQEDPDPTDPLAGQVWYNTGTDLFKGAKDGGGGVWTLKAAIPLFYLAQFGAAGTPKETFAAGLAAAALSSYSQFYELLSDSWSSRSGKSALYYSGALVGDSSSEALTFGGTNIETTAITEQYDGAGDSWSNRGSMTTDCKWSGGTGTVLDALTFGGMESPGAFYINNTERYDGTGDSWSTKSNLNLAVRLVGGGAGGVGTANDALRTGGIGSAGTTATAERYDGTGDAWTNKAPLSAVRESHSSCSTAADALIIGGKPVFPAYYNTTEVYDGALDSWSFGPNINVAREPSGSSANSSSNALTFGGKPAAPPLATEYLESGITVVTFTVT